MLVLLLIRYAITYKQRFHELLNKTILSHLHGNFPDLLEMRYFVTQLYTINNF